MHPILVIGINTAVGKTIVSAILTVLYNGDYWKPVQSGETEWDSQTMQKWFCDKQYVIHPSSYSFKAPISPHHAAHLERCQIHLETIKCPETKRPLIIEGVGGIYTPLTFFDLSIDLFKKWPCQCVIVSRHYLGSINHTLLTIEALKQQKIKIKGLIFNGLPEPATEKVILNLSNVPFLGRLLPENNLNLSMFRSYAIKWKRAFLQ